MFGIESFAVAILGFLLVLGPLVTLHELGHYLVGRWFGVKAEVFSVGFGKEIAGFTDRLGTRWRLSAIPLGGYVQFAGDMNPASQQSEDYLSLPEAERNKCFQSKSLWKRSLIVAAGPVMNLIIGVVIFAGFALSFGKPVTPAVIEAFAEDSPALAAGMELGDRIVAIDDAQIDQFEDISLQVAPYPGRTIAITFERDGAQQTLSVPIASLEIEDSIGKTGTIGRIGVGAFAQELQSVGLIDATVFGVDKTGEVIGLIVTGLGQIVTGERSVQELGGPIAIAGSSGERLSMGPLPFIEFIAFISINLAFINLLPIPVLDGGHLAFYAAEAVRRKPVSPRSQEWAFRTGLAFVLALMLFVTLIDIVSLPIFGS